jgi:2-methylisocitrate lyase-like PEP mutase family enzyme
MKTTTNLRQMLQTGPMVVAPFILNAMHAKIAEAVGFPAVYMTGAPVRRPNAAFPTSAC